MSCKDHSIFNNKCEYCGVPACELGKKDHNFNIFNNKCEYCGIPACEVGKKQHYIWNNKYEYYGTPAWNLKKLNKRNFQIRMKTISMIIKKRRKKMIKEVLL